MFQSPRNRVKCSDDRILLVDQSIENLFQSPRNRVKCSDALVVVFLFETILCFNPLEIGSNVLIPPF